MPAVPPSRLQPPDPPATHGHRGPQTQELRDRNHTAPSAACVCPPTEAKAVSVCFRGGIILIYEHPAKAATHLLPTTTPRYSSSSSSKSGATTPWTYTTTIVASQTPQTVKDLPLPPPVLQPLRKHETTGRAPPPRRRAEPAPQGLGLLVVLPGVLVALLSGGFATTFFLYLALHRGGDAPPFSHGFYVDEGMNGSSPLLGLVASTVITNVVWLVGFPILATMAAYCIAGSWLSYQQHPRSEEPNLLTPLQYGLLFKLFSAPGPRSTYQVGAYLANRRARVAAPSFFSTAFILMASVLGLSYLISAADLWLHTVSTVVLMPSHSDTHDITTPLAPALSYILLLYLHAALAALLTLRAALLRSPPLRPAPAEYPAPPPVPTALRLAHVQLTDALAPVAARLSSRRMGMGTGAAHNTEALFVEDVNTARVEVGVWAPDGDGAERRRRWGDGRGDGVFGVYKKVVAWRGEI
ncbi:hypothetical protein C8R46DRAFT_1352702 [Mycena filopes]|nr:hypothetical protein C8R46DRAFT_1352702 [Mycena filopes]